MAVRFNWRDKFINGVHVWLRRSRYVAREFGWLSPERQDLFSPASSGLTVRLLPTLFMTWKSFGYVLCAIDIADAFLMVSQKESTQVTCELATGECTASAHLCQSRQANRLGLQVCSNVVVLNSFSHGFESDTVVKPLCPLANLFCGCFCLGSGPFCVSGLLFLLTKRKSGWGICGSSGWFVGCLVWCDLPSFLDLFWSLYK